MSHCMRMGTHTGTNCNKNIDLSTVYEYKQVHQKTYMFQRPNKKALSVKGSIKLWKLSLSENLIHQYFDKNIKCQL